MWGNGYLEFEDVAMFLLQPALHVPEVLDHCLELGGGVRRRIAAVVPLDATDFVGDIQQCQIYGVLGFLGKLSVDFLVEERRRDTRVDLLAVEHRDQIGQEVCVLCGHGGACRLAGFLLSLFGNIGVHGDGFLEIRHIVYSTISTGRLLYFRYGAFDPTFGRPAHYEGLCRGSGADEYPHRGGSSALSPACT